MPRLRRSHWFLVLLALALAALFSRLGVWQVHRLEGRRSLNAIRRARMAEPPLALTDLADAPPADSLAWRRVRLVGRYDFGKEVVLRGRSHLGMPGVELLTPLQLPGGGLVPVLRGWLPAADALHADLSQGRPPGAGPRSDSLWVDGLVVPGVGEDPGPRVDVRAADGSHASFRHVSLPALAGLWKAAVPGFFVEAAGEPLPGTSLARVPGPELGNGPHLSYAIQWFSFALISIVGTAIYIWSTTREGEG